MPISHRFAVADLAEPLRASLSAHGHDDEVSDVTLSHESGMSNETVFFRAGGRDLVARIPAPEGAGLFLEPDIAAEHALMASLAAAGLPVPEPLFLETDAARLGTPFMVMPRVAGHPLFDDPPYTAAGWLVESGAETTAAVNDAAIRALADLHAVDPAGVTAPPGRDTFAARLDHAQRWAAWGLGGAEHPVVDAAIAWLRERTPANEALVVTWGDARISNMIFGDDHSVHAMLDWELAALGARETDLGWWLFAYHHHTEGIGVPAPPGFPDAATLVARYEGLSGHTCRDLEVYEVLGGVQAALIMVRVASQMIEAGMLPPDSPMALVNPATILLSRLIGMPELGGGATSFIGNRG